MGSVMVIGSGGREHALAWKLANSSKEITVYCSEGNAGTAFEKNVENVSFTSFNETLDFIKEKEVDLVVVGSEKLLAEGLADLLRVNGVRVFGFGAKQAMLESSKVFSREFCQRHGVNSPKSWIFSDSSSALAFFEEHPSERFFVKADELCGGKGAIPAQSLGDAVNAVGDLLIKKKCGLGEKILVEEWLDGRELTIMAFTDGHSISLMPASQDHKRLLEGDKGLNTGGMGAYSPAPLFDAEVEANFRKSVLEPTLEGLKKEGFSDAGIIYFGLIVGRDKSTCLLEFNVRFGDPEAQPVLSLLESDLLNVLDACCDGRLGEIEVKWKKESAVCVTLSVAGYPEVYGKERDEIFGLSEAEEISNVKVFHAGTKIEESKLVTCGGRILSVTATGCDLNKAKEKAYQAVKKVKFRGMHYRKDIAAVEGL